MLNPDYKDMLSSLVRHDVEFILIGAYALAFHGIPRATGDIDFLVACSVANSRRVHRALIAFGAPVVDLDPDYFSVYGNMFQIGVAPCRIDLLTQIDGVTFQEIRTVTTTIEGLPLRVISTEDFIRNKRASGRAKDLADIEALEAGGT